jgi:hypothetical protein
MTTLQKEFSISVVLFLSCFTSPFDGRPEKQGILNMRLDHESPARRNHALFGVTMIFPEDHPGLSRVAVNAARN